jgi:rubrerythrin
MENEEINNIALAISKAVKDLNIEDEKAKAKENGEEEVFNCPECGTKLNAYTKYCPNCGIELEWE